MIDDDETNALAEADELALRAITRQTFTCNQCSTQGSLHYMSTHDCAHNQQIAETGGRCEDYPCCGHTDGDGCATNERHTSEYWSERMSDPDYDPYYDEADH
jgi:hypothetical protein